MRLPRKRNRRSARGIALTLLVLLIAFGGAAYAVTSTTTPTFSLMPAASIQTVAPGGTVGYGIGLQATGGFSDNVLLSVGPATTTPPAGVSSTLPQGASPSFGTNPSFVDASLSSSTTLWVTVPASTQPGTYQFSVTGQSSGGLQQTIPLTLNVSSSTASDFSLMVTPSDQYMSAGSTPVAYSVSIGSINGFSSTSSVTLSAKTVPGAVSLGWNSSSSLTTAQNPTITAHPGQTVATLYVGSTTQNPPGSYAVTITGTSGGIQHSTVVTLNIDLFSAMASVPGQLYPGNQIHIPVTLTNPYNYAVTATGLAAGVQSDPTTGYVLDNAGAPIKGCLASWFKFTPSSLSSTNTLQIPANGSVVLPASSGPSIELVDAPTNQDACKGAVVKLNFIGSGQH